MFCVCVCVCVCDYQDLTVPQLETEMKGRKRGLDDVPSFFCWFADTDSNDGPAEIIKDDIWPNPLQFFLVCMVVLTSHTHKYTSVG